MVRLSTPAEGYNSKLLKGLGQLLEDEGLGTYAITGTYPEDAWAIFVGLTPDKPDLAVTLMTYPVEDSDLDHTITGVQFRLRGGRNPLQVEDMSDAIFDLLHNKQHYVVNSIPVDLSWRQSGTWMGQDTNQRVERVENFYFHAERSAPNKIP